MPTVGILQRLMTVREHAVEVARRHDALRMWEGIAQVLSRKMESERKYIERLEGKPLETIDHSVSLLSKVVTHMHP